MEIAFAILAFVILCAAGIAWDYYNPPRFCTNYSNVDKRKNTGDAGGGWFDGDGDSSGD